MSPDTPTLHLMCGLPASGKSTLSATLGAQPRTIVIAEDDWLAPLFGDQMSTLADYVRCAAKLRAVMAPHVAALLQAGTHVVLDFPANTPQTRVWMRDLIAQTGAAHVLHLLDVPPEVCKARLRARNASGEHAFAATDEQFDRIAALFVPPSVDEGFSITRHG